MPIHSHQAQIPALVRDYFRAAGIGDNLVQHHLVASTFTPDQGWKTTNYRKRVSASWLRKLRSEGVTAVGVRCGARVADFGIDEILSHQRAVSRRPLLGGSVI